MLGKKEICPGCTWTVRSVKGSYDFKIGGYSSSAGKCIASGFFMVGGYKWRIFFYPPSDGYASLFIALASHASDVRALFELTFLDQSGNGKHLVRRCTEPYTLKSRGSKWGQFFVKRESLEILDYVKEDCLLVHCTVGVVIDFTIFTPPSNMSQNLNNLLETETGCDIVLHVGDKTFKAHKVILAAGSPVFRALFFGLVGNPNNMDQVEFKEVEPVIFKAMLWFIYSDTLPDLQELTGSMSSTSTDIVEQLLAAADRFGVDRLKHLCEAKLGDEISADTLASTLAFADKHSCSELKSICLKFASKDI